MGTPAGAEKDVIVVFGRRGIVFCERKKTRLGEKGGDETKKKRKTRKECNPREKEGKVHLSHNTTKK